MSQLTTSRAPGPAAVRPRPAEGNRPTAGQHHIVTSIVLHLFPGLSLATFVVLTASTIESWGMDPFFAFLLGIGLVIAPLELGYLSLHAHRTTGSWSPLNAVDYRTTLPVGRLLKLGAALAAFMLLFVVAQMAFLDRLIAPLFSWMPGTLFQFSTIETGTDPLTGAALGVMLAAILLFNGVVGPVVEELYFRGHLLPRLDRYGRGAPLVHAVLFTLYHVWTPWRWPQVLLGGLPTYWMAWRTRSAWLSMTAHIMINLVFSLLLVVGYLEAASHGT